MGFVSRLAARVCRVRPFIRTLGRFEENLVIVLDSLLQFQEGHAHVSGKMGARLEELLGSEFCVVLALPCGFVGRTLVQRTPEWRFTPPLSRSLLKRLPRAPMTRLPTPKALDFLLRLCGDMSLMDLRRCGCCRCCCCCCCSRCCRHVCKRVQYQMQRALVARSDQSLSA